MCLFLQIIAKISTSTWDYCNIQVKTMLPKKFVHTSLLLILCLQFRTNWRVFLSKPNGSYLDRSLGPASCLI